MKQFATFALRSLLAALALSTSLFTFADLEDTNALDNTKNLGCDGYHERPTRAENTYGDPFDYKINFSQGKLTIAFSEYASCECLHSLTIKRDGNILWVETVNDCSNVTPDTPVVDCLCFHDFEASLEGIEEGDYTIITPHGIYFATLTDGLSTILDNSFESEFTAREDAEWVFYNPGDENHEPTFIRSRMRENYGVNTPNYFNVFTCIGEYDQDKAVPYGYWQEYESYRSGTSAIPIPSILFGINSVWEETFDLSKRSQYFSLTSKHHYYHDLLKDEGGYMTIKRVDREMVDGKPSFRFTFTNGFSFLGGVGFVGDNYANTLCGTSVDLPEGTVPTHFLYMRSLVDNHIIYGDPTLDPSYDATAVASVEADEAWFDNGVQFGIRAAGDAIVTVYALNGQVVAQQAGRDEVLLSRSQLDQGVYLVRCSAPGHLLTRKLTLR